MGLRNTDEVKHKFKRACTTTELTEKRWRRERGGGNRREIQRGERGRERLESERESRRLGGLGERREREERGRDRGRRTRERERERRDAWSCVCCGGEVRERERRERGTERPEE